MSKSQLKVLEHPATRVDVPRSLRQLADRIARGLYGDVRFVGIALIQNGDKFACFGYGKVSDLELSGAFARASVLSGSCLDDCEEAIIE